MKLHYLLSPLFFCCRASRAIRASCKLKNAVSAIVFLADPTD